MSASTLSRSVNQKEGALGEKAFLLLPFHLESHYLTLHRNAGIGPGVSPVLGLRQGLSRLSALALSCPTHMGFEFSTLLPRHPERR